ncbi:hypothetical protein Pyn_04559 [Prunus yedoensis var. nudiflora]|uniref:Uncharacterized protein n=1 Tax=Prunus yedoensis var. nudiflora TaxID=2094558 RepID=A0A314UF72_PRUYE|nr:hypothetical protein Pyn_04559 [Prunus yedoensis var. nudiflora]
MKAKAGFARRLAQVSGAHSLSGLFLSRWRPTWLAWGAFCPVLKQGWTCSKGGPLGAQISLVEAGKGQVFLLFLEGCCALLYPWLDEMRENRTWEKNTVDRKSKTNWDKV